MESTSVQNELISFTVPIESKESLIELFERRREHHTEAASPDGRPIGEVDHWERAEAWDILNELLSWETATQNKRGKLCFHWVIPDEKQDVLLRDISETPLGSLAENESTTSTRETLHESLSEFAETTV